MMHIMRGIYRALTQSLGVKGKEEVVVVTDSKKEKIGRMFAYVSESLGASTTLLVTSPTSHHAEEPNRVVSRALQEADVFIAPTTHSLTYTKAVKEAVESGARGATLPMVTEDVIARAVDVDYRELKSITTKIMKHLKNAHIIKVTNRFGTLIRLNVADREWVVEDGDYTKKGRYGNLPAGQIYIAPKEYDAKGKIVFHSFRGTGEGMVTIDGGKIVEFRGELGNKLRETLTPYGENALVLAKFGIGTNPAARVTGNVLEDEKVLGTVHFAFGSNVHFGGTNEAPIHESVVVIEPTIEVDGKPIMVSGKVLI